MLLLRKVYFANQIVSANSNGNKLYIALFSLMAIIITQVNNCDKPYNHPGDTISPRTMSMGYFIHYKNRIKKKKTMRMCDNLKRGRTGLINHVKRPTVKPKPQMCRGRT